MKEFPYMKVFSIVWYFHNTMSISWRLWVLALATKSSVFRSFGSASNSIFWNGLLTTGEYLRESTSSLNDTSLITFGSSLRKGLCRPSTVSSSYLNPGPPARNCTLPPAAYTQGIDPERRAWRLSGRYRGIARVPLGPESTVADRFNHEFGVNVSWDPNP
jgi:hypothetical protein